MKLRLLSIIALSGSLSLYGQEPIKINRCSQMDAEQQLQKENPNRLAEREAFQKELDKWVEAHPYDSQKKREQQLTYQWLFMFFGIRLLKIFPMLR